MLPARAKGTAASPAILGQMAEIMLDDKTHRLVLVDGRFAPELSAIGELPSGVWFGSMADAVSGRPDLVRPALETASFDATRSFAALNAAFFADGFVLDVASGIGLDRPVEILHLAS